MNPLYEVVKAYGPWSVGHVFTEMPGNVARTLIARNLIKEKAPAGEGRQLSDAPNRMMPAPDPDLLGGRAVRKVRK